MLTGVTVRDVIRQQRRSRHPLTLSHKTVLFEVSIDARCSCQVA
jgi:hypothetical protein